jgi:hypothetical protein
MAHLKAFVYSEENPPEPLGRAFSSAKRMANPKSAATYLYVAFVD